MRLRGFILASLLAHAILLGVLIGASYIGSRNEDRPVSLIIGTDAPPRPRAARAQGARAEGKPARTEARQAEASSGHSEKEPAATAGPPAAAAPMDSQIMQDYLLSIRTRIRNALHYPVSLRRQKREGLVHLRLAVGTDGSLQSCEISQGSGHAELDQLALAAARSASPFDRPQPEWMKGDPALRLVIPIEFRIN